MMVLMVVILEGSNIYIGRPIYISDIRYLYPTSYVNVLPNAINVIEQACVSVLAAQ